MKSIELIETKPLTFQRREVKIKDKLKDDEVLLKPLIMGICGSDLHYFFGHKDPAKLKKRLPMVLLHEGVAEVIPSGKKVVVIPFESCGRCEMCLSGNKNLCLRALFMASNAPGLARSPFIYKKKLVLPFADNIPSRIAALTEPISVALRAIRGVKIKNDYQITIIGDGSLAFFVALLFRTLYKISKKNLLIIGIVEKKLALFKTFSRTLNILKRKNQEIFNALKQTQDLVFEAAGGEAMRATVLQAIDLVRNQGTIILLGLSDERVPLPLSAITNRALILKGSSRSKRQDYLEVLKLMKRKEFCQELQKIIDPRIFKIKSAQGLTQAFNYAAKAKGGRVMVEWKVN